MYALVTGASAGIGLEIARYLAVKGYDLILTARREDRLEKVRGQILDRFPDRKVLVIPADLSKREECMRLYEESCDGAGSENIDFVVNNAGMGVYGRFLETDLEKELTLIDLNVTSVHILSKLFLRLMAKNGHGVLLNVGSCAGFTSGPTFSSYYASKNYVVRLTEAIHEELRQAKSPVKVRRRSEREDAGHSGDEDEAGHCRVPSSRRASVYYDQLPCPEEKSGRVTGTDAYIILTKETI